MPSLSQPRFEGGRRTRTAFPTEAALYRLVPMHALQHELLASTGLVTLTVAIHLAGLDTLLSLTRLHLRRFKTSWLHLDRLVVPLGIVLGLFVLHGLEIWLYALVYWLSGLLPSLEQALYVSISTYSTLGEAGAHLPTSWRVMGALESINGMLMIGWSTAFLFQILRHLLAPTEDEGLPAGAISRAAKRRRG
jgi:hypothetical protein